MLPRRDVDDVVSTFDICAIEHKERSCSHKPADGSTCVDLHLTVLAAAKEVAVGFEVELVHVRQANSWNNMQARDVLVAPGSSCIVVARCNTHMCSQPWYHGLALTWRDAVAVCHWMCTDGLMDLCGGMP